jgi:Cu/Ag efflux protein CusF
MNIDLSVVSPEEAERLIRADIESRGLDPSTMKVKLDHLSFDAARKMSFTFHFEGPEAKIRQVRGEA